MQRIVAVELMDEATRKVVSKIYAKNWIEARRLGISILRATPEHGAYVRLHDIRDASDVDFITRERLQKSLGIRQKPDKRRLESLGVRKTDHTGNPTEEYQQYDSTFRGTRGRVI